MLGMSSDYDMNTNTNESALHRATSRSEGLRMIRRRDDFCIGARNAEVLWRYLLRTTDRKVEGSKLVTRSTGFRPNSAGIDWGQQTCEFTDSIEFVRCGLLVEMTFTRTHD